MLNQVQENFTAGRVDKAIAIPSGAGTLIYIVPTGKKFTGSLVVAISVTATLTINGGSAMTINTGATGNLVVPLSLLAGDTVSISAVGASIIGVESWA